MKNKYDTAVVFLYAIGKEHLLPIEFRKKIPKSTISTWRSLDYSKYLGHEFRYFFDDAFDKAQLEQDYKNLRLALFGIARSWVKLSTVLRPLIKNARKDKKLQLDVLEAIGYMKNHIGLEKTLKVLSLSQTLYNEWLLEARFECFDSYTALCIKRHPHQLGMSEVKQIKTMLTDPELDHWPIVSIAGLALRKKKIVASLYSWYKYARLLNITKKPVKKDRKTIGLVATKPNEYLHVDTTYYPLIDGTKVCITFVMDNFSKMILGFHVANHLSFDVVKNAISRSLKVIARHPEQKKMCLVSDGGKENNNREIDNFIKRLSGYKIKKVRALKDIRFSNSPVEAVHRTVKGRYLKNRKFDSIDSVNKYMEWVVRDYNILRPHYKHRPRTPQEVYFGQPLSFDVRQRVMEAVKERIASNKCSKCIQCLDFRCKKLKKCQY